MATAIDAALELDQLNRRVEVVRSVLIGLQEDVVRAEARLDGKPSRLLVEANEQLVVAALLARRDADAAADALTKAARFAQRDV